jgi:hypothetical protein
MGVRVGAGHRPRASRTGAGLVVLTASLGLAIGGCSAGATGSTRTANSAAGSPSAPGTSSVPAIAGTSAASPVSASPVPAGPVPEAVPSYYAEATAARVPAYDSPDNISIRVTGTGAALAMARPPAPYQSFGYLYATADPDVWVAGAQRWHPVRQDNSAQPVTLFKVTFSPVTRRVTLTRLPAPALPGSDLAAAALSPDGGRLALVTLTRPGGGSAPRPGDVWLSVYPVGGRAAAVASRELATIPSPVAGDYSLTCCAISVFPGVLWASPNGGTVVADGLTQANDGAVLDIRPPDGQLRRIPWPGLSHYPDDPVNVIEPPLAW